MSYGKVNELQTEASIAEVSGNYKQAFDIQTELAKLLPSVIANGQKKSDPRRRAKLQLKAVNERLVTLRPIVEGAQGATLPPLPSSATIAKEVSDPSPGTVLLSQVEMGRSSDLIIVTGLPDQPDPAEVGATFLTPLLSTSLPDVTYQVFSEIRRDAEASRIDYHVRDDNKNTHYTFSATKRRKFQIPRVTMTRAAEYATDCAIIDIAPIKQESSGPIINGAIGRAMSIRSTTQTTISEKPDAKLDKTWTPRRFTYGNRRFVWREEGAGATSIEKLYEVEKETDNGVGNVQDQTNSRVLAVATAKPSFGKPCTITMVGGLDQMFREYLLASQVTRRMVERDGHI